MSFLRNLQAAPRAGRIVALTAAALGLTYGYDISNIAAALLYLEQDFGLDANWQALMATSVVIGQIVGAIFGGGLANAIGRKKTMIIVAIGYIIFALLSALAPGPMLVVLSRIALGVVIGLSITVVPVFIAESSPNTIRGGLLTSYQVTTVIGIIFGYIIGWALSYLESWRLMLGAAAIPAAVVLLGLFAISETPQWLAMKGRDEQARATIAKISGPDQVDAEWEDIQESLRHTHGESSLTLLREMLTGYLARATWFAIAIGFFIQITGINATIYYAPRIFEQMGFAGTSQQLLLPAVVQFFSLLAVIVSMVIIDSFGRRKVLLTGISVMLLADAILIAVYAFGENSGAAFEIFGMLGILLFTMGYTGGFGAIVWVFAGELFPTRYRAVGSSLVLTADLVANAIVAQAFPPLLEAIGGAGVFTVFAVLALAAMVVVYKFAPETKGRRLDEIQQFWENGGRWEGRAEMASASKAKPETRPN